MLFSEPFESKNMAKTLQFTIITTLLILWGCTKNNMKNSSLESDSVERNAVRYTHELKIPTGDEMEISVRTGVNRRAIVTLHNKSNENVFLSYAPSTDPQYVSYIIYRLEKLDEATGVFKKFGESGHYAPELLPIEPGNAITFRILVSDHGTYRFKLRYMIDKEIATLINERFTIRPLTKEEEHDVSKAYISITSPTFSL